jgi:hypothetical protein
MKVAYHLLDSDATSVAYLDSEPGPDGAYSGEDKYTDRRVRVAWDSEAGWVEVPNA